jgi:hypothetical protein
MIMRDEDGRVTSLMECPRCENYEQHELLKHADNRHVFQCGQCFAMFGNQD